MVVLTYKDLTFCQFFFNKDTKKLTLVWMLMNNSFSFISTWPTATAKQSTFLSWNLTWERTSLILF